MKIGETVEVGGETYRAEKDLDLKNKLHACFGCAAYDGGRIDYALCNALPPCNGVVFVEVPNAQ